VANAGQPCWKSQSHGRISAFEEAYGEYRSIAARFPT
jgi:hypothetical protein